MALGIAFSMTLVLTAVFSANPWEDHTYGMAPPIVAGMSAPHRDGRDKMVCSSCHVVTPAPAASSTGPGVLPIVAGTPAPHTDGRENMNCANCHTIIPKEGAAPAKSAQPAQPVAAALGVMSLPAAINVALATDAPPLPVAALPPGAEAHETMVPFRFQGKVLNVAGTGTRSVWGTLFVLVDDGINVPYWIDLAPKWFLQAGKCTVRPGQFIKGTGLRDMAAEGGLGYAMSVMANGEVCELRDNHLRGMWTQAGEQDAE
ncbi:magnetochrome domain-containing protein [Magnetospirillum sp. UT-4]|uniref:magnetochrome domain-containing protein n=1 Tax=Magnetospirillum sp. UT-4 TaxID=2681467 RepID=UPI00157310C0|nr:magnetochrome domain-containing protein [Magnetospirillum sp. UT-4]